MKVIASGTVIAHRDRSNRSSLCFPRIAVLPGGRWIAAARAAAAKQDEINQSTIVCWSDDQGKTWSEPIEPFGAPKLDGRDGRFRTACLSPLPDGRVGAVICWQDVSRPELPLFNPKTEGNLDLRLYFATSSDRGQTWSTPVRLNEHPNDKVPVALCGPALVMPDGRLAVSYELSKCYDDPSPWRHAAVMSFSRDGGKTWAEASVVGEDLNRAQLYWDQRAQVMRDGSVLSVFWTYNTKRGAYDNMHAAVSRDSGRTWSEAWDTGIQQQPAPPVPLNEGRVALVYVDRAAEPVIKMRVSKDGGRTFPPSSELLVHRRENLASQNAAAKRAGDSVDAWMEMEKFSLGLPDAVSLGGDEVLVVFYSGSDSNHTDMRWARVDASA